MPVCYDLPEASMGVMVRDVMAKYHEELFAAEVTVQVLFARMSEGEAGPAVKAPGGWPALAVVRRCPLKQRVAGFKDAEITIDERKWKELSEPQQIALLDHELQHLELVYEGDGAGTPVATDDWGRPKLKLRKHDWELAGFKAICDRHPDAALEKLAAQKFQDEFGQYVFGAVDSAV
jgi:hypothetical protein